MDIFLALSVMAIGLEVLFFVSRGALLRASQAQLLQGRINAVQAEVTQTREQVASRQAELATAQTDLAQARATLKQAEEDLAAGRKPREVLVHRIAGPSNGTLFRATVSKVLPATPEPHQALIWSYENVIELQATDAAAAQKTASRAFAATAGYVLGELQRVALPVVFAPNATAPREAA